MKFEILLTRVLRVRLRVHFLVFFTIPNLSTSLACISSLL